jgi:hypothetical protein
MIRYVVKKENKLFFMYSPKSDNSFANRTAAQRPKERLRVTRTL